MVSHQKKEKRLISIRNDGGKYHIADGRLLFQKVTVLLHVTSTTYTMKCVRFATQNKIPKRLRLLKKNRNGARESKKNIADGFFVPKKRSCYMSKDIIWDKIYIQFATKEDPERLRLLKKKKKSHHRRNDDACKHS